MKVINYSRGNAFSISSHKAPGRANSSQVVLRPIGLRSRRDDWRNDVYSDLSFDVDQIANRFL